MDIFMAIIALLAGLGAFLLGFKLLGDNMEKLASGGLKKMFNKTAKSKLAGVGIGAAATAIVQSSSVTTVMVVGFVNVGIMSLYQATAVIMGANIGTTITGHITALQSVPLIEIATALTAVGIFMDMFSKKDNVKTLGLTLAGLGLVFMGLGAMSDSMADFRQSPVIEEAFRVIDNPFLLLLIGLVVTAIVQSSSAVTGIIITMATAGFTIGNGGSSVLYLILGTNIGTCVTALLSSIGASRNAKRACLIHVMFNTFGAIIFFAVISIWDAVAPTSFMEMTFMQLFPQTDPVLLEQGVLITGQQIAWFHTFFNVVCTILFLPFTNLFVKLSGILIPERAEVKKTATLMDKRLLLTPSIAIEQLCKERVRMADMSMENLCTALRGYLDRDEGATAAILQKNEEITSLNKEITDYLVQVSSEDISVRDEKIVSTLHHNIGDIERIAEIADNLTKYTRREIKHNLVFSSGVNERIEEMFKKLEELYKAVKVVLEEKNLAKLKTVDALEDEVDGMRKKLINEHIERLNNGCCKAENSSVFINLISNLERVGDHLCYLAHSVEEV